MDCNPPGSSLHGIFQARTLEWVAISYYRGIFLTQRLNSSLLCLLHWQVILYHCTAIHYVVMIIIEIEVKCITQCLAQKIHLKNVTCNSYLITVVVGLIYFYCSWVIVSDHLLCPIKFQRKMYFLL